MAYSVTNLKADLNGILHGTTTSQITGLDNLINRAARQVLMDVDPNETIRLSSLTNPVFDQVFDYAAPADLKGEKVIDIRPQVNRTPRDRWSQKYSEDFDINKDYTLQPNFNTNWNGAVKTLRIDSPQLNTGILLNNASSLTSNGTWTATAPASNLTVDNVNFFNLPSSLKFDLAALGSVGYLENSTMNAQDLTSHRAQSSFFLYTYLPTAANYTNLILRVGSDSSNYWTFTATTTHEGNAFTNGWNLIRFDWTATSTVVGSPVVTAIDYLRVSWTYNGTADVGVRLNGIYSRLGTILQIMYYSKYLFRDASTLAFKETTTADTDLINLDTDSYNLLLFLVALYCTQQMVGTDTRYDTDFFTGEYQRTLQRYQALYKSQIKKPQISYYKMPKPGMSRYFGNRWFR